MQTCQRREDPVQPRRLLRLVVTAVVCGYILGVAAIETNLGETDSSICC